MNYLKKLFHKVSGIYLQYERPISSLSLLSGFIFTALTLKRVDLFIENLWVVIHLLAASIGIVLINLLENKQGFFARITQPKQQHDTLSSDTSRMKIAPKNHLTENFPTAAHFWLTLIIQFGFGGLFSTFLVFYFRSATLEASWPFLALLTVTFIANEALKKHYTRQSFQISVLFISIYSFAIFSVPVVLHRIGADVFVLSGILSLMLIAGFLYILSKITKERFRRNRHILFRSILGIFVAINVLYFTNLIPPIPLSLKDAGVYHSLVREGPNTATSTFSVTYEPQPWTEFFKQYEPVHYVSGEPLYVYSAIFSPADFNTKIIDRWQHYDEKSKKWLTVSTINLSIVGGREDGYRTYSMKNNLDEGKWRVQVMTSQGQEIGRIKFEVIDVTKDVLVERKLK